jgi:hypothetical protein
LGFRDDWGSIGEHRHAVPSWMRAGLLLVALMLACSGIYWWWQRPRHSSVALETPPVNRVVPPLPVATPAPPPPSAKATVPPPADAAAVLPPTPAPVSANPATPATATPAPPVAGDTVRVIPPNPNASVRISISAPDEAVWMGAYVDGKYLCSGTLQPHESRNIDVDGTLSLRLGNAGGAVITQNGKPVGPVGPKGQVRTVQFTSGGFQISPPKSDLLDRL